MPEPNESPTERVNRELMELLNELKVALPGVQVLFAFLLILPFQSGFGRVTNVERVVYAAALIASVVSIALLMAPSVLHRVNFRRRNKERILFDSNALLIAGTAFTAIGIAASVFVVIDVLYGPVAGLAVTLVAVAVVAGLWGVLPVLRRAEPDEALPDQPAGRPTTGDRSSPSRSTRRTTSSPGSR